MVFAELIVNKYEQNGRQSDINFYIGFVGCLLTSFVESPILSLLGI